MSGQKQPERVPFAFRQRFDPALHGISSFEWAQAVVGVSLTPTTARSRRLAPVGSVLRLRGG
jgi:hypothetical protein